MRIELEQGPVFREQARAWLTLIAPKRGSLTQVIEQGGQRVVVAETVNCPDGFDLQEILLVRGDFQCGAHCRFPAGIYVGGRATLGRASTLNSICVEGPLTAGLDTRIERWADARGRIDLRAGAWVREAVSGTGIDISQQAGAGGLFAPRISTHGSVSAAEGPVGQDYVEIPLPGSNQEPELGAVRGFRRDRLMALGTETWVYDGSLSLPFPVLCRARLVVRGSFICPPGSLLEDDVKAGGSIRLGKGSVANGNLSARGELTLDEDCLFSGNLRAGLALRLRSGVRGYSAAGPVEVRAQEQIHVEPNVVIRGRLASQTAMVRGAEPLLEGGLDLLIAEL